MFFRFALLTIEEYYLNLFKISPNFFWICIVAESTPFLEDYPKLMSKSRLSQPLYY